MTTTTKPYAAVEAIYYWFHRVVKTTTRPQAAVEALHYWFQDVVNPHDINETLNGLIAGRGQGSHDNITISFHSNWEDWEPEHKLFQPGQVLLSAQWPQVDLPDHADLDYPITYEEFCYQFRAYLETNYFPNHLLERGEIMRLLKELRRTLGLEDSRNWPPETRPRRRPAESKRFARPVLIKTARREGWSHGIKFRGWYRDGKLVRVYPVPPWS
ncbi:MAG: hypothetical protein LBK42_03760 [Propionibacteriaceae bacterium]|jgi:hypothetical protein|nr:hypothetical protein [Propionibacteriaceae bacterium]